MMATDIGLYLHIPFCVRKCNYCDFCSSSADAQTVDKYVSRLIDEINGYRREVPIAVNTVFFGGGTPSLLSADQLRDILFAVRKVFRLNTDTEITIEVNPKTASEEKMLIYHELGVNRISIGMQSIHKNEQKILGRIHDFDDFLATFNAARRAGIRNISVDIMYGIPEQTRESFEKTLSAVISLAPEHISCYGLIIEEGTPFYLWRDNLALPTEDEECDMYELAHGMLTSHGYRHYEISNYSVPGCESRHNLKYWHDEEYIGLGVSSHSYFEGKRFYNTSSMNEYLSSDCITYQWEIISGKKDPFEYAMLALRLADGILLSEYESLFGAPFAKGKEKTVDYLISEGLIGISDGRLYLTPRGFYVSNSIMAELL